MKFKTSLLTYGLADIISRIIGLITSPITTRLLTMSQYGANPLLSAIWTPFALAQYAGMDSAYPFFKARNHAHDSAKSVLVTTTIVACTAVCIVWSIFLAAAFSGEWLTNYADVTSTELFLFILGILPASLIYWLCYLLRFLQRADSYIKITLFGRILPVIFVIPLLPFVAQEHRLLLSLGLSWILACLAFGFSLYEIRKAGFWPFDRLYWSWPLAKDMLSYGLALVPAGALYSFIAISDRLLVGFFLGPADVAVLTIGMGLGSIGSMMKRWFGLAFDPHRIQWVATGDNNLYLPRLQLLSVSLSSVFSILTILSTIWSLPLVDLLYASSYRESAVLVPLLMLSSTFSILSNIAVTTALIADNPRYHTVLYSLSLVINVAIGLALIPKLGLIGAIFGTVIAEFFILIGWILLGKIHLKNLPLDWRWPSIFILIAFSFVIFYNPLMIRSQVDFIILTTLTICTLLIFSILLWVSVGHQNLKKLIRFTW